LFLKPPAQDVGNVWFTRPQNARRRDGDDRRCVLRVEKITADGERIVTFDKMSMLCRRFHALPAYVNRPSDESDAARYQTVFARKPGAWLRLRLVCILRPRS